MTDNVAKMAAKGLQSTGVTEELARRYYETLGSTHMAIVEFRVGSRSEDNDGQQSVRLDLISVEPATGDRVSDHLRDLQRAIYMSRTPPTLDGTSTIDDVEQTTDQVIDRADAAGDLVGADD